MNFDKRKSPENLSENGINIDSLLDNLSKEIGDKFGLEVTQIKELISFKQKKELKELKTELSEILKQNPNFEKSKIEELASEIIKARETIEIVSKNEREKLISELVDNNINIETFENTLESNLPSSLINAAKNPSRLHHHILGVSLGLSNSIVTASEKLIGIGKGITKLPYDLYLIASGKGEYSGFKKI